jgi:hypothetical protein
MPDQIQMTIPVASSTAGYFLGGMNVSIQILNYSKIQIFIVYCNKNSAGVWKKEVLYLRMTWK